MGSPRVVEVTEGWPIDPAENGEESYRFRRRDGRRVHGLPPGCAADSFRRIPIAPMSPLALRKEKACRLRQFILAFGSRHNLSWNERRQWQSERATSFRAMAGNGSPPG